MRAASASIRTVTIPTTLSAGEYTASAGCTDTARQVKESYGHPLMMPKTVLLDPRASLHTPEWLFLSTGIRAVDHAVEDICSPECQPISEGASYHALKLLGRGLSGVKADPLDLEEDELRKQVGLRPGTKLIGEGGITDRMWMKPSISILGIDAPKLTESTNQLVPSAKARVSMRIPPGQDADAALKALAEHLRTHVPWGAEVSISVTSREAGQTTHGSKFCGRGCAGSRCRSGRPVTKSAVREWYCTFSLNPAHRIPFRDLDLSNEFIRALARGALKFSAVAALPVNADAGAVVGDLLHRSPAGFDGREVEYPFSELDALLPAYAVS